MLKAVIFDMDGVLVDSEPFWRQAMIKGFKKVGLILTEDDCRKTTGMRLDEVIEHWKKKHNWTSMSDLELHDLIIDDLCEIINQQGTPINGANDALNFFKEKKIKIGLASSSNNKLIQTVIKKLNITDYFEAVHSAEHLKYGKPHPQVFIDCANSLNVLPTECLVIEDSLNGVIAAKASKMKVIAVPDKEHQIDNRFVIADCRINSLTEINHQLFTQLNR